MCIYMQLYKISYEIFVKNYLTDSLIMAVEVNSTPRSFFEQRDLFVIYQSLINAVCLIKSNSEDRGMRKKKEE